MQALTTHAQYAWFMNACMLDVVAALFIYLPFNPSNAKHTHTPNFFPKTSQHTHTQLSTEQVQPAAPHLMLRKNSNRKILLCTWFTLAFYESVLPACVAFSWGVHFSWGVPDNI